MPSLTHKRPDGSDRTLEISDKPLIVGRVPESDIMVKDSFVSRVHCGFGFADSQFTLKDLGSTNGTYRNGARVFQCALASGDKIQVGNTTLVFEVQSGAEQGLLRQVPQMVAPASGVSAVLPRPSEKQLTVPVKRRDDNSPTQPGALAS
jgi:pSer/pThr/pTyr-binding forkhead associated (FHA) protein